MVPKKTYPGQVTTTSLQLGGVWIRHLKGSITVMQWVKPSSAHEQVRSSTPVADAEPWWPVRDWAECSECLRIARHSSSTCARMHVSKGQQAAKRKCGEKGEVGWVTVVYAPRLRVAEGGWHVSDGLPRSFVQGMPCRRKLVPSAASLTRMPQDLRRAGPDSSASSVLQEMRPHKQPRAQQRTQTRAHKQGEAPPTVQTGARGPGQTGGQSPQAKTKGTFPDTAPAM